MTALTGSRMPPPYRYQYTGSYVDPKRFHFGSGNWMSEGECRAAIAARLRDPAVNPETLHVVVQEKKTRWTKRTQGSPKEVFPDVWETFVRERAMQAALAPANGPERISREAQSAIRQHGDDPERAAAHYRSVLVLLERASQIARADLQSLEKTRTTSAPGQQTAEG